jgi:fructokinase
MIMKLRAWWRRLRARTRCLAGRVAAPEGETVVAGVAVAGEALIDLVVGADGRVDAHPGGGPFNAARTMARLGVPTAFLGRLAGDGFGRLLRERLTEEGVGIAVAEPSGRPSTLAVVAVDDAGVASYSFYLDGTSVADLDYAAARRALPAELTAVHVGSLGLLMEPVGTSTERLLTEVSPGTLVLLDPNCRPGAVTDRDAYRGRIDVFARRADIVKASVEDLAYLYPDVPPAEAAAILLAAGPSLVLLTDGPHPARAFLPGAVLAEPVPAVVVADTIGAGDAFGGGFLAWWLAHDLGREDLRDQQLVATALRVAAAVAALTCARPGADPPARADLQARNWWPGPPAPRP